MTEQHNLGWPYGQVTNRQVHERVSDLLKTLPVPSRTSLLINSAIGLVLTLLPLYGIWHWQWNVYGVLVYYFAESLTVLAFDALRYLRLVAVSSKHLSSWHLLAFHTVFLTGAGFMMLVFLGPKGSDLLETLTLVWGELEMLAPTIIWPLLIVSGFQLESLIRHWHVLHDDKRYPFVSVINMLVMFLAPFVAVAFVWAGELAGVIGLLVLRLLVQQFWVWVMPLMFHAELWAARRGETKQQ